MNPEPPITKTVAKIGSTVVTKTLENFLEETLTELREGQANLRSDFETLGRDMRAGFARIDTRLDDTNKRIDDLSARFDKRIDDLSPRFDSLSARIEATSARIEVTSTRIDGLSAHIGELTVQQGRMLEAIGELKRDHMTSADLLHRMARIEDRVFARAS